MRVLIVSDNHGEERICRSAHEEQNCEINIHLGDSELPAAFDEMKMFHCVKGNVDKDEAYPLEGYLEDVKIFYTHGHKHKVKGDSRDELAKAASKLGAKYAFYGHTHVAKVERLGDVFCINPGSIKNSKSNIEETYAVLDTVQDSLIFFNRRHKVVEEYDLSQIY